jgi:hypothetical protein
MAVWKTFATKLGLLQPETGQQTFLASDIGLCLVCGSLKFNPECSECRRARWQSLLIGLDAEETADVQG